MLNEQIENQTKENSIFYGIKLKKRYRYDNIDSLNKPEALQSYYSEHSKQEIHRCSLATPLQVGNSIYVEDLRAELVVSGTLKDTDGNTLYYTNYATEVVEDNETDRSLAIACENRRQETM